MLIKFFILLSILFTSTLLFSQDYEISKSEFVVSGSSSLHDWELKSTISSGKISFKKEKDKIKSISKLNVSLLSKSLKSKKKDLDENAYESLNVKNFPTIEFEFKEIISIKNDDSKIIIKMKGILKIAGVEKNIVLDVLTKIEKSAIIFEGEIPLKFTDFKINPPKALMGTVKTGNEIKIKFFVNFE